MSRRSAHRPQTAADTYWLLDLLPFQAAVVDPACRIVYANRPWRAYVEEQRGPFRYDTRFVYFDENDPGFLANGREAAAAIAGVQAVVKGEQARFELDHPAPAEDGRRRWFHLVALSIPGVSPPSALLLRDDETSRFAMRNLVRKLEFGLERASDLVLWVDVAGRIVLANDRACRALGYTRKELLEVNLWDVDPNFSEGDWQEHLLELRELGALVFRSNHRAKDGSVVPLELSSHYFHLGSEELCFLYGREQGSDFDSGAARFQQRVEERTSVLAEANARLQREIASHEKTEIALRESQERLELALAGTNLGLWDWDIESGRMTFDRHWASMVGYEVEELAPDLEGWTGLVHPDDELALRRALDDHLHGLTEGYEIVHRLNHRSGEYRWFLARGKVAERDERGAARRVTGTLQDITARKHLEDQLLQSQKMEAVGQLAGGVAHDFNNLLTAINGYADLVLRRLEEGGALYSQVEEIRKAGERAATLTDRLLAFSRKQLLQPEILNLNDVITNMHTLLAPAVGEGIEMVTVLDPDLPPAKADQAQMEQALLNLVVNARDAMSAGGRLTIRTTIADSREVQQLAGKRPIRGSYVMISITDTGCGIEPRNLERVFEPFFTTKDPGHGTGLGLSMVYGIVRQTGGLISIQSQVGQGTRVRVFLPTAETEARPQVRTAAPEADRRSLGGSETLLLVEDEDAVRELVNSSLESEGYRVLVAASAEEAFELLDNSDGVLPDLLLTDVVLPGQSGPQLAATLEDRSPGLRVLFVSGYARDALGRAQILGDNVQFLQKPFTLHALLRKIRTLLDQQVRA